MTLTITIRKVSSLFAAFAALLISILTLGVALLPLIGIVLTSGLFALQLADCVCITAEPEAS